MQLAEFEVRYPSVLETQRSSQSLSAHFPTISSSQFDTLFSQRRRRVVRSQKLILVAILEACRSPTVQHWIMVKA
ncbi:MAG: hypothetical protein ACREBS_00210, partial [Nitrososphaerales archaeon]